MGYRVRYCISQVVLVVKNLAASAGDIIGIIWVSNPVQFLCWKESLEEEMATYSSILAWRIPWTEEPGRLHPMALQRVRHD